MTRTASPTNPRSTHDIVLTKGGQSVGLNFCDSLGRDLHPGFLKQTLRRTSIQMREGKAKYSDMELPWQTIVQNDWSNGINNLNLSDDSSAYAYGNGVDTCEPGQIIMSGMPCFTKGYRNIDFYWPHDCNRSASGIYGAQLYHAIQFTPTASYTMTKLFLILRKVGNPTGNITVAFYDDDTGVPGSSLSSATFDSADLDYRFTENYLTVSQALTSGTPYWIVVTHAGTATDYVEIMTGASDAVTSKKKAATGDWSSLSANMFWRGYESWLPTTFWLKEYKGAMFAFADYGPGGTPKVFINGDQGVATGGATTYLDDSTKSWTNDEWIGATVIFYRYTGSDQYVNYAKITDNTGTRLVFDAVATAPAGGAAGTATEYVIVDSDKWTEITGTGLSAGRITDVLEANGAIYVCQGDVINVRKLQAYSSGTPVAAWTNFGSGDSDEGYTATYMIAGADAAGNCIWKANGGYPARFYRADPVDCTGAAVAGALAFGAATNVGNYMERITGLETYGENGNLHVLKEASIWEIINGVAKEYQIREMRNTRDKDNGRTHLVQDMALWFSWSNGLERYFDGLIDGMGVEKGKFSNTYTRLGRYKHLSGYPGKIIASYGSTKSSGMLLVNNGAGRGGKGWCNWMTANDYNSSLHGYEQINYTCVQSIPGSSVHKLWVSRGADIVWMPIMVNPAQSIYSSDDPYIYNHHGYFDTSWIDAGFYDINKLWKSIALIVEDEAVISTWDIQVYYMTSSDIYTWTHLDTEINSKGKTEINLSSTFSQYTDKIRFRFCIFNANYDSSPRIIAMALEYLLQLPVRWSVTAYVRMGDKDHTLQGQLDDQDHDAKLALLETFSSTPDPALATSRYRQLHNKYYAVNPNQIRPVINTQEENHSGESNTEVSVYSIQLIQFET